MGKPLNTFQVLSLPSRASLRRTHHKVQRLAKTFTIELPVFIHLTHNLTQGKCSLDPPDQVLPFQKKRQDLETTRTSQGLAWG